jgi:hypothetical protein
MSISIDIKIDKFDSVKGQARQYLPAAVFAEAVRIMNDSQANYVPVQTGELRRSGKVEEPRETGSGFEVTLSYGADYALYVHEAPPGYGQGKRKFLETPVNAAARGMDSRVAARLKQLSGW